MSRTSVSCGGPRFVRVPGQQLQNEGRGAEKKRAPKERLDKSDGGSHGKKHAVKPDGHDLMEVLSPKDIL